MAKNEAEAEAKSGGKKRLARAKIKRADVEATGKGDGGSALSKAERTKRRKERVRNVAIAVFAVVIAFAMALPSLSTIFSNNQQYQAAEENGGQTGSDDGGTETRTVSEDNTDAENMEIVDENYRTTITPLEEKLKENSEDLATILNLGNGYKNWAYAASSYSSDDKLTEHVKELFKKAIEYYDQYLKLNDSNAVRVDRALCTFYSADSNQEGIDEMIAITESSPDYAPAWGNLGLMYESTYQTDKAKETYQKAAEVDAEDTYGVKSFANGRIASLNSSEIQSVSGTIESTTPDVDNEAGQLLMDKLVSESKTSF